MIFVTVGGGPYYGFNRLVQKMDEIAQKSAFRITMQTGCSSYTPCHAAFFTFISMDEMLAFYGKAKVIVAHASGAPVIFARDFGLPLVLVPRMQEFGEIFDDHQYKTARQLESEPMIEVVYDMRDMEQALDMSLTKEKGAWPVRYEKERVMDGIRRFIRESRGST